MMDRARLRAPSVSGHGDPLGRLFGISNRSATRLATRCAPPGTERGHS
jgi:hypothetical protein